MKLEILFIFVIIIFAIAFPVFERDLGSAGAILLNGGLIVLAFVYFLIFGHSRLKSVTFQEKKPIKFILNMLYFYFFAILLSLIFSQEVIVRDFYELHRPVLYILILIISLIFFRRIERLKYLEVFFSYSFIIVVFLGLNQYFHVNNDLSALYTKTLNIRTGRISSPFPNPYDYSFFMLFSFCYFSICSLMKEAILGRFIYIFLSTISIVGIFFTQARTGFFLLLLEVLIIIPTVLLIDSRKSSQGFIIPKKVLRYVFLFFGIIVLSAFIYTIHRQSLRYLTSGVENLFFEQELVDSAQVRIDLMQLSIEKAKYNFFVFLFGNGPSKALLEYPEAGYTYFIFRYGFLTLVLVFFAPLIVTCFYLIKIIRERLVKSGIYLAILAWYFSIPFAYFSANFTEQIRLSFFYYFLMAFSIRSYFLLPLKR